MSDIDALLAAIEEDPEDEARFLVLADALTAAGDPRGELIVLQHALAKTPYDRELARAEQLARRAVWPEQAEFRLAIHDATWRLGFVDALELGGNHIETIGDAVRAASATETTRHVRKVHALTWADRDGDPRALARFANLRELVVESAVGWKETDLVAVASSIPRLESLKIGNRTFPTTSFASLPASLRSLGVRHMRSFGSEDVGLLPPVRALSLYKVGITDESISRIGESVRDLEIDQCRELSDGFVWELAGRELQRLRISTWDAALDSAELVHLRPGIEELELYTVSNAESALTTIANQPRLQTLQLADLSETPVSVATFERVLALPDLRELAFRCKGAMTGTTSGAHSGVERLQLVLSELPPALAARLPSMPLRQLGIAVWDDDLRWADDELLAVIAGCAQLDQLRLNTNAVTDAGLRSLHGLSRLTELALYYCKQVTTGAIALACALPALRTLDLSATNVTSLDGLAHHPTLAELDLSSLKIGAADLAIVATLPNLRSLRMRYATIGDADLAALLPAAPTLRRLDLEQCKITPAATDVLRQFQALEFLNVRSTVLGEAAGAPHNLRPLRAALPFCRFEPIYVA